MNTIKVKAIVNTVNVSTPANQVKVTIPAGIPGPQGPAGAQGEQGEPGEGVPTGGLTGQVLKKNSNTDFDTIWQDETGGGLSESLAIAYAIALG